MVREFLLPKFSVRLIDPVVLGSVEVRISRGAVRVFGRWFAFPQRRTRVPYGC